MVSRWGKKEQKRYWKKMREFSKRAGTKQARKYPQDVIEFRGSFKEWKKAVGKK